MPLDPSIYNQVQTPTIDLAAIDAKRTAVQNANIEGEALKLKNAQTRLGVTAKLLNSVKDQNSYSRALKFAMDMGMAKPGQFDPQYDPQTVEMLKGTIANDINTLRQQELQIQASGGAPAAYARAAATDPLVMQGLKNLRLTAQGMQAGAGGGVEPIQGYNQTLADKERIKASSTVQGKSFGEAESHLADLEANFPELNDVISKMKAVGQQATYTKAGKVYDAFNRQLDLEPRESAVAREQYVNMAKNQVFPILKQTFGAQFTKAEGDALLSTLGDAEKSPAEKEAALNAFIDQQTRNIKSARRRVGKEQEEIPTGQSIGVGLKPSKQEALDELRRRGFKL